MTTLASGPPRLHRDRFTLTMNGWFIAWGWVLYSFNPAVPLLARELGVSNAAAGLHGTAMAVGALTAAAVTPRLVRRAGRRMSLIAGGVVMAAGVTVLVTGQVLPVTLLGMVITASGANVAISAAQAGLANHHGPAATAAVSEANGVGAGVGLVGPLAVGGAVALGWGWRPAVAVAIVFAVVTSLLVWWLPAQHSLGRSGADHGAGRDTVPDAGTDGSVAGASEAGGAGTTTSDGAAPRLGERVDVGAAARASRWFLVTILAAVGVENATTYWASDLVVDRTGADAGIATATTAGLVAGMTLVRFVISPLSLRVEPARLLATAFGVSVLGWAVLWTATVPAVALGGLFVAGLGYGALYPLGIALLLGASLGHTDRAQARSTVAGGAAIGVAPFLLGLLADLVGAHSAFVIVPVIAVAGGVATVLGARAWRTAVRVEGLGADAGPGGPTTAAG